MQSTTLAPEPTRVRAPSLHVRDFFALAKPRITAMVLVTTAGGLWLAPAHVSATTIALALVGVALIVSGANALNMVIERDLDGLMKRTKNRPLPTGRLAPRPALIFGVVCSVLAVPILGFGVNATTALLAVLANLLYVLAYTPLKQRSHFALQVGAVPGAIPPLLGWTAATGRVDAGGLVLFAILFLWQIPHFHAIALFRRTEYARAGLVVLPNARGIAATKLHIAATTAVLLFVSLLPFLTGMVGPLYVPAASFLGVVLFGWALVGLRPEAGDKWARSFFGASLPYVVLLFAALLATKS